MTNETREIEQVDGPKLLALKPPIQRAAYSDRTAWQMALLAELAYIRFEKPPFEKLFDLSKELAALSNAKAINKRLEALQSFFRTPDASDGEKRLKATLKASGFELVGTFYNRSLNILANTEGYVAKWTGGNGREFAVLSIRGTTSPQDWINNANVGLESIGGGRQVHKGFHKAYSDVEADISKLLKKVAGLPLYITGHSLGGAVAVIATWYQARDTLAACYTFGAPRVGNHKFNDGFKTPIYRVVNSFDPVPLVPPTRHFISILKFSCQVLSKFFLAGFFETARDWLKTVQGYRHAGDLRHMTSGEMDDKGGYPTVKYYTHFGLIDRIERLWMLVSTGQLKRLDMYHNMTTYRRKLRYRALERAPK